MEDAVKVVTEDILSEGKFGDPMVFHKQLSKSVRICVAWATSFDQFGNISKKAEALKRVRILRQHHLEKIVSTVEDEVLLQETSAPETNQAVRKKQCRTQTERQNHKQTTQRKQHKKATRKAQDTAVGGEIE